MKEQTGATTTAREHVESSWENRSLASSQFVADESLDAPLERYCPSHGGRIAAASLLPEYQASVAQISIATKIGSDFVFFLGEDRLPFRTGNVVPIKQEPSRSKSQRYAGLISLLETWLADDSGYDEAVWPRLKARIEDSRTSERKRFSE